MNGPGPSVVPPLAPAPFVRLTKSSDHDLAPGAVQVETLVRATYELPGHCAEGFTRFLQEHVGGSVETRVEGCRVTVTAAPEAQRTIGGFIALMSREPAKSKSARTAAAVRPGCENAPAPAKSAVAEPRRFVITAEGDRVILQSDGSQVRTRRLELDQVLPPVLRRILPTSAERPAGHPPAALGSVQSEQTVHLHAPGGQSATAWEVTTTGVHRLAAERTPDGLSLKLPPSKTRAAVILTDNPVLIRQLEQKIEESKK